jgi:hypothetical protein
VYIYTANFKLLVPPKAGYFFQTNIICMYEKRPAVHKSPDLSTLKAVIIDHRTTIFVAPDMDPEEARQRYKVRIANRKP